MPATEPDIDLTKACTCGHTRNMHGWDRRLGNCISGGCGCVRFVAVPELPANVASAIELFTDAKKQEAEAEDNLREVQRHVNTSTLIVTNAFLELYNALPVEVRNKVRHAINTIGAINTTKDGQSPTDPKRAEP